MTALDKHTPGPWDFKGNYPLTTRPVWRSFLKTATRRG